jgi:hypothetical protein
MGGFHMAEDTIRNEQQQIEELKQYLERCGTLERKEQTFKQARAPLAAREARKARKKRQASELERSGNPVGRFVVEALHIFLSMAYVLAIAIVLIAMVQSADLKSGMLLLLVVVFGGALVFGVPFVLRTIQNHLQSIDKLLHGRWTAGRDPNPLVAGRRAEIPPNSPKVPDGVSV